MLLIEPIQMISHLLLRFLCQILAHQNFFRFLDFVLQFLNLVIFLILNSITHVQLLLCVFANLVNFRFQMVDNLHKFFLFGQEHKFDGFHLLLIASRYSFDSQFHVRLLVFLLLHFFFQFFIVFKQVHIYVIQGARLHLHLVNQESYLRRHAHFALLLHLSQPCLLHLLLFILFNVSLFHKSQVRPVVVVVGNATVDQTWKIVRKISSLIHHNFSDLSRDGQAENFKSHTHVLLS